MELTLDEALKKSVEAHQAGQTQEAERLYDDILRSHPEHPDANHNMGVLAVGLNKMQEALAYFKTALDANPSMGQYWLSYINALIKLGKLDDAKALFDQAKDKGAKGQAFDQIEQQLIEQGLWANKSSILNTKKLDEALRLAKWKLKEGQIEESKSIYQDIIQKFPKHKQSLIALQSLSGGPQVKPQDPPTGQLQPIIHLYTQGQLHQALFAVIDMLERFPNSPDLYNIAGASHAGLMQFDAAVDSYKQALKINPNFAEAYNNMGIALKGKNDSEAAIESYKQALKIKPDYAEAYYNIGNALRGKGDSEAAIESYKQALKIKPDYAEVYNNMGNALKNKGDLAAAIDSYKQAIKIKYYYAEAHNNMGITLKEMGDLDASVESYKQALKIKPDYAEAYNNMGMALNDKGESKASIDSYNKALKINPSYTTAYRNMAASMYADGDLGGAIATYKKALKIEPDSAQVWNNLGFPLQAIKLQGTAVEELLSTFMQQEDSNGFQIAKSVLSYRLHLGGESAERALNEVLSLLPTSDNTIITNPEITNYDFLRKTIGPDKIVALVHFGRSGTGLLHSLIDSHPKVSTLPSIYFSEFFNHSTWERLVAGGWDEMATRFIATYEVLFDASVRNPIETKSKQFIDYLGQNEGMANVGDQRDEVLRINKTLFREELHRLMSVHDHLDAFTFFKLAHLAYNKSLNDLNHKHLIFYHIHNPDVPTKLNFAHAAPNANWVMMVREPLQACESWIRSSFHNNEQIGISSKIFTMLFEIDNVIYQKQNAIGVRLEDLKESPRKTIPALCDWMGIKETESLYEMTAQGKQWWGDTGSPDYEKDGMKPFGNTSIRRKVGAVFTANDQFILHTLFYPFSVRFGYAEENLEQFKADLQAIRPMLDEMFGFEIKMAERTQVDAEQFMKSGSYLYLRSGLIDRWNVLSKFHTYPHMIKPLNIN